MIPSPPLPRSTGRPSPFITACIIIPGADAAPSKLFFEAVSPSFPSSGGAASRRPRATFFSVTEGRMGAIAGFDCVCICRFDVVNVCRELKGAGGSVPIMKGTKAPNNKTRDTESRACLPWILQFTILRCSQASAL